MSFPASGRKLRSRCRWVTALGLLLAVGVDPLLAASPPPHPASPAETPQPPRHAETIYVQEAGVLVEMPPSRRLETLRRAWRPADFQLLVDGRPQEVVGAGPSAPGWEIVLYLDPELTPAAALADAARLLAGRVARLAALGSVEIVIADPEPRIAFAPSRDVARGSAALLELAGATEGRAADFPARRLPDLVRRQCDRLIAFAARGRDSRPRVLFFVGAADLPISAAEQTALSGATAAAGPPPAPSPLAAAFVETAQALAAAGWVTFPLAVRPLPPPPPEPRIAGDEAMQRPPYNSALQEGHPFSGLPQDPKTKAHRAAVSLALDAGLLPQLAPLNVLAAATAGQVVQAEIQLDDALDSLGRRWQLWFRPAALGDGRLHRLAVRLDGQPIRAPAWVRGAPVAP